MRVAMAGLCVILVSSCATDRFVKLKPSTANAADGADAAWSRAINLLMDEGYQFDVGRLSRADGVLQTERSRVGSAKCVTGTRLEMCPLYEVVTVVITPPGAVRVRVERTIEGGPPPSEQDDASIALVQQWQLKLANAIAGQKAPAASAAH